MAIKLFIPGPTVVSEDILKEMCLPMIGHRSKKASEIQKRTFYVMTATCSTYM